MISDEYGWDWGWNGKFEALVCRWEKHERDEMVESPIAREL